MNSFTRLITILFPLMIFYAAQLCADEVEITSFTFNGTGCNGGDSVRAILSPDAKKISIFFDDYLLQTSGRPNEKLKAKCHMKLDLNVPANKSLALFALDYRGFVDVAPNARASLLVKRHFTGQQSGGDFQNTWGDADVWVDEDFLINDEIAADQRQWSRCGKRLKLQVMNTLALTANAFGDYSTAQIDTIDGKVSMTLFLQEKDC